MSINTHQGKHLVKHFFTSHSKGHGVHSPFVYRLCEEVFYNKASFYDFEKLQNVRDILLNNNDKIETGNFGAGSRAFKSSYRKIKDIALKGITPQQRSELFYRLINFLNCHTLLELGTSLGMNTLYLASANRNGTVYSIEGSEKLFEFAAQLAEDQKIYNIRFIQGLFDETLPQLLKGIQHIDFLYVDGNHSYKATVNYFYLTVDKRQDLSVFIFDDIYWSKEMTKAWEEIISHPAVKLSIDFFHFGMIFFNKDIKEKTSIRLWL